MKSLSLYDMTSEMLAVLEAEEVDEQMMEAAFGALVAKDNRICHFIRSIELAIIAYKMEENRITDRRKAMENKVDQLKKLIQLSMERMGFENFEAGTFKLKIQANPPALDVVDESLTPPEFLIVVPATTMPDKAGIKEALKRGEAVPGYALKSGRSLRIR